MARVVFWGSLKAQTGGDIVHDIAADNIRQLLDAVQDRFPALGDSAGGRPPDSQFTISIDGMLYNDDWFQPIAPDSEVYILPRIAGG